jgi:transcriptional regulator with XRE-family HTH domain
MNDDCDQITAAQFRAARMLTNHSPLQICRALGITRQTLSKAENTKAPPPARYLAAKLRAYHEAAGVEFVAGEESSVRMKATGHEGVISGAELSSENDQ